MVVVAGNEMFAKGPNGLFLTRMNEKGWDRVVKMLKEVGFSEKDINATELLLEEEGTSIEAD